MSSVTVIHGDEINQALVRQMQRTIAEMQQLRIELAIARAARDRMQQQLREAYARIPAGEQDPGEYLAALRMVEVEGQAIAARTQRRH